LRELRWPLPISIVLTIQAAGANIHGPEIISNNSKHVSPSLWFFLHVHISSISSIMAAPYPIQAAHSHHQPAVGH
jgi:hypothetical protein